MRTKKIFMVLSIALTTFCLFGCGDDEENTPENDSTEQKGNYTATTSVKEVKLTPKYYDESGLNIYEDFNYKYELKLYYDTRELAIFNYKRADGKWSADAANAKYDNEWVAGGRGGFVDMGKCDGIEEVTSQDIKPGSNFTYTGYTSFVSYYHYAVQPNHGYAAFFTTENDEVKFLRIYVKSYTLDGDGALNSVTVQYQLY